jgi:hypothetical protein
MVAITNRKSGGGGGRDQIHAGILASPLFPVAIPYASQIFGVQANTRGQKNQFIGIHPKRQRTRIS